MVEYTIEDLQILENMARDGSPMKEHLIETKCDPYLFGNYLKSFPKEYDFVFNLDYLDLPLSISDPRYKGYLYWRIEIRK